MSHADPLAAPTQAPAARGLSSPLRRRSLRGTARVTVEAAACEGYRGCGRGEPDGRRTPYWHAQETVEPLAAMRGNHTPTAGDTAAVTGIEPLTVDTRGLAALLCLPYSTVTKLCAAKAWQHDELPAPVYIGRGSTRGDGSGARRWVVSHVERWLDERTEDVA